MKRPWRAHFTKDWYSDPFVRGLELEARMVYFELLDIAWDEDGLHDDWVSTGAYVAHRIGISRPKFKNIWRLVSVKFERNSAGFWSNPRLEQERLAADSFAAKQSNNAKSPRRTTATVQPSQSQSQSHPEEARSGSGSEASSDPGVLAASDPIPDPPFSEDGKSRALPLGDATAGRPLKLEIQPKAKPRPKPLPFTWESALAELSAGSAERFIASAPDCRQITVLKGLIATHSALATWRLVGEWFAAGGEAWREAMDTRSITAGNFSAWVKHSSKWAVDKRPAIGRGDGRRRNGRADLRDAPGHYGIYNAESYRAALNAFKPRKNEPRKNGGAG